MATPISDPLAELTRLEGVGSAAAAARDALDAVLRDRGRRTVSAEQSAAALLAAARATAALEINQDDHAGPAIDWTAPAVRLYTELVDLAGLIRVSPGQAIARSHAILCRGIAADDDLGRVRPGDDLGARLTALQRLLTTHTDAPVIVLAGVAHAELITMAPFVTGNGMVARAVQHMILIDGDLDRPAVTVPEAGHQALEGDYRRALAAYRTGAADGVRDWLLHVCEAVAKGAELSPLKPIAR
ncbi:Fic family protein [Microlunatus soli]|uniref:Fic/DOC family protein n=1 Tax=Microlunatus soli TaxID=630515 RepID=A0A1H1SZW2_9ACTN|nr:Fic family protein [Microlunatus soli]SDS52929.1 Fic/DOC family protein [Microlunatus soli]